MAHWHRDPKRLKFLEYLNRAEAEFVLDPTHFSQDEFLRLQSTLSTSRFAGKVSRGACSSGGSLKVLIVAHEKHTGTVMRDTKQWAGIFVVPGESPRKERTLAELFLINPFFSNGAKGSRVVTKGGLRSFVLDARVAPPMLSVLRADRTRESPVDSDVKRKSALRPASDGATQR